MFISITNSVTARKNHHRFFSGSSRIPSASSRLRASSNAHVCILYCESAQSSSHKSKRRKLTSCPACSSIPLLQTANCRRTHRTTHSPTLHFRTSHPASLPTASQLVDRNGLHVHDRRRDGSEWRRLIFVGTAVRVQR